MKINLCKYINAGYNGRCWMVHHVLSWRFCLTSCSWAESLLASQLWQPHLIMHSILIDPLSPYSRLPLRLPFRPARPKTQCVNWWGLQVSLWRVQHRAVNLQMSKHSEWALTSFEFKEQESKTPDLILVGQNKSQTAESCTRFLWCKVFVV